MDIFLYVDIYVCMYMNPTRNLQILALTYIYIHNYTHTHIYRMLVHQVFVVYVNIHLQYILIFRMYMYMCISTCNLLDICNLVYSTVCYYNYTNIDEHIYIRTQPYNLHTFINDSTYEIKLLSGLCKFSAKVLNLHFLMILHTK